MTKPPPAWAHKWCRNCVKHGSKSCNLWHLPGASACTDYQTADELFEHPILVLQPKEEKS